MPNLAEDLVKKSQEKNKDIEETLIKKIKVFLNSDLSRTRMSDSEIKNISNNFLKIKNEG